MSLTAGIDIGSITAKAALLRDEIAELRASVPG